MANIGEDLLRSILNESAFNLGSSNQDHPNNNNNNNNTSSNYDHLRRIAEPVILFSGIVFNLALVLIVYAKKRTKGLRSTKPLRYLLISMLVSDTWYLVSHVNVWYYFIHNKADLSSLQVFCQLNTYFNYFFAILLEFNMLAADWIILRIVFKSTAVRRSRERAISVYNQFQVGSSSSYQQRQRQQSTSAFVKAAAAAVATQNQTRNRNKSISGRWAARLSVFFPGFGMQRSRSVPVMIQPDKSVTSQLNDIETINEIASSDQQQPPATTNGDRTTRKSTLVSTTNLIGGGINTSTSLYNNQNYSTSNDDETFQKRANFFNLIMDYNFKNESAYFDIILKEKVAIILNFFVWMYLLSFLLWIRGVDTINTDLNDVSLLSALQLSPAASSSTITTTTTTFNTTTTTTTTTSSTTGGAFYTDDDYSTTASSTTIMSEKISLLESLITNNNIFEPSVKSFCFTHKFALSLFRFFVFSVAVLRLVTMFANFLASICFHFKFRHEYYNAFRVSFKDKNSLCEEERDGGSRILSYKSFQTWVSIKEASKLNRRNKKYSNMSESTPTTTTATTAVAASSAATTAVAAATSSAMTSATGNAANAATAAAAATTLKNLDTKRLDSHYSHFHFIRHYALVTFFYACICAPSILADTVDTFKDVYRNLAVVTSTSAESVVLSAAAAAGGGGNSFKAFVKNLGVVDNKENTGKILINLSECLAHSFKLLVYVLFSTHLNCHFRFVRRRNNKLRGASGGGNAVGVGGAASLI